VFEPKLDLQSTTIPDLKFNDSLVKKNNNSRKIVRPSSLELKLHKDYLKHHLQKNFYN
jgi:hypothetical protein